MCEYCEGKRDISDKVYEDGSTFSDDILEVKIMKSEVYVGNCLSIVPVMYEKGIKRKPFNYVFPINYCPKCGKGLK